MGAAVARTYPQSVRFATGKNPAALLRASHDSVALEACLPVSSHKTAKPQNERVTPQIAEDYQRKHQMFQVSQEIEFCYGHRLLNYAGKCRHLHGHNGKAVIVMESETLDDRGMVVDFTDIKTSLRTWIDDELDHRMILNEHDPALPYLQELNEPVYVVEDNPTAENIAKLIYQQAVSEKFPVVEVRLWETPKAFATYKE
jgi:6-pyruvoyltetrahydropterin/6-carboxytetrahydropterin synthase